MMKMMLVFAWRNSRNATPTPEQASAPASKASAYDYSGQNFWSAFGLSTMDSQLRYLFPDVSSTLPGIGRAATEYDRINGSAKSINQGQLTLANDQRSKSSAYISGMIAKTPYAADPTAFHNTYASYGSNVRSLPEARGDGLPTVTKGRDAARGVYYARAQFANGEDLTVFFSDSGLTKPVGALTVDAPRGLGGGAAYPYLVRVHCEMAVGASPYAVEASYRVDNAAGDGVGAAFYKYADGLRYGRAFTRKGSVATEQIAVVGAQTVSYATVKTAQGTGYGVKASDGTTALLVFKDDKSGAMTVDGSNGAPLLRMDWNAKSAGTARFNGRAVNFSNVSTYFPTLGTEAILKTNAFVGSYAGNWVSQGDPRQKGPASFSVSSSGALSGRLTNNYAGMYTSISGSVNNVCEIRFNYSYPNGVYKTSGAAILNGRTLSSLVDVTYGGNAVDRLSLTASR